jgi:formiminotetrahydrofolate cyclodeaminase
MTEPESDRSLTDYLAAVASAEPTPGGGSVVAVVAALAAALGEMVCRLTIGRPAYAAAEFQLHAALIDLAAARERLVALAIADETAYRHYLTAVALPKESDAARAERRTAMQAALVDAIAVPLAVASACRLIGEQLVPVARRGNRHALSDAVAAAFLVDAARRGALLNVTANAALLDNRTIAEDYLAQADAIDAAGRASTEEILGFVRERGDR